MIHGKIAKWVDLSSWIDVFHGFRLFLIKTPGKNKEASCSFKLSCVESVEFQHERSSQAQSY